jgi:hypothetical protein
MEPICQHCKANLDDGDILEHFLLEYFGNYTKAREIAGLYGWTETNHLRFNRAIIIQPTIGPQYPMCPECYQRDPIPPEIYQPPRLKCKHV